VFKRATVSEQSNFVIGRRHDDDATHFIFNALKKQRLHQHSWMHKLSLACLG